MGSTWGRLAVFVLPKGEVLLSLATRKFMRNYCRLYHDIKGLLLWRETVVRKTFIFYAIKPVTYRRPEKRQRCKWSAKKVLSTL